MKPLILRLSSMGSLSWNFQRFSQYAADRMRWTLDAEQCAEGCGHVHWFRMGIVDSGMEWGSVKRERHMSVVAVRGGVIGSRRSADGEGCELT